MNICQQCGACCAYFRVSFYWAEALELQLPDSLIEQVSPHLAAMAGTHRPAPRCHALQGTIGKCVSCLVYSRRPSPCRELQPADEKCNRARANHGLSPLREAPAPQETEAALLSAAPGAGHAILEAPPEAAIALPDCAPDGSEAVSSCATDASASMPVSAAEPATHASASSEPPSLPGSA
ncbi:MAG: YkgJ family cysteine cluster protein [Steroidobacteraceae bacterium]|nr:YkgJ family cysteine cluster protein [Steroidobacteraceae bacterium]